MNYFNIPCPACGEAMKDGDDIVVCPECATPHHRECWKKNGQCVNTALHSEGFVWTPDASSKPEDAAVSDDAPSAETQEDPDVTLCHICGSENPKDALHCGNCGALFGEDEKPKKNCPFCGGENDGETVFCRSCGAPLASEGSNPFMNGTDTDANEIIGNYSAGDYALYTQLNTKNYIPKFRKLEAKKITFNWGAFLFGPNWFLFRKIYKVGVILLVVFASVTMMTAPLQTKLLEATEKFYSQSQPIIGTENAEELEISDEEIEKIITTYYAEIQKPMLILSAIMLVERILCGFIADRLYYKKINADLKIIGETVDDKGVRNIMIARRGSVSFLAFFAGNLGEQVLLNLLVMAADAVSGVI